MLFGKLKNQGPQNSSVNRSNKIRRCKKNATQMKANMNQEFCQTGNTLFM
jgi:hypothetical protein